MSNNEVRCHLLDIGNHHPNKVIALHRIRWMEQVFIMLPFRDLFSCTE